QALHAWFAHVPGLKVVLPTTPYDAKGLLVSSIEDDNPVMFIEHRWLYNISGPVPEPIYRVPIGTARVMRAGTDVSIIAISYMALEALRAADALNAAGISAEVIDLRSLRPWDEQTVLESVRRTGRVVVTDIASKTGGFGAEVLARISEEGIPLLAPPVRVCLPDSPTPTSPALAAHYYPRADGIASATAGMFGMAVAAIPQRGTLDVPDPTFTGPF